MQLSPSRFNALLKPPGGLGQKVEWRRAHLCPCRDPVSGQARPGCLVCRGRGTFWGAAIRCHTGLAGQKAVREWAAFGLWESGDVVLTIPSDSALWRAGELDRVRLQDSSETFTTVLSAGTLDQVRTGGILEIERAFYLDGQQAIVELAIPAWDADGNLTWSAGGPPAGTRYTISGRRHPEYFIFKDLVQDRAHHGGLALPRRVVARRFDLFGR